MLRSTMHRPQYAGSLARNFHVCSAQCKPSAFQPATVKKIRSGKLVRRLGYQAAALFCSAFFDTPSQISSLTCRLPCHSRPDTFPPASRPQPPVQAGGRPPEAVEGAAFGLAERQEAAPLAARRAAVEGPGGRQLLPVAADEPRAETAGGQPQAAAPRGALLPAAGGSGRESSTMAFFRYLVT